MTTKVAVTHIFRGYVMLGPDGDASSVLYLVDPSTGQLDSPLADQVNTALGYQQRQVTVSYHITDQPQTEDELTELVVLKLCGVNLSGKIKTAYSHRYSEMTGYLWTDEEFKVGGHDVIRELTSYAGKFCHLIVVQH